MEYVRITLQIIIMIKNVCFIHAATVGNYQQVFDEMLKLFDISNIWSELDSVFINIAGELNINIPKLSKINIFNKRSDLRDFEFSTVNLIKDFSQIHNSNILYLHLKGVTAPDNLCVRDHKDYMFYFNILQHKSCIKFLNEYDAIGVDLSDDPVKHYSGNIWWSKTEHIKKLPYPKDLPLILSERHKCEFWICSRKEGKYKSLHQSNINVYQRHLHKYPLEKYRIDNNL